MKELETRLKKQLLKNNKVKLLNVSQWCIPVQSIEVKYQPVKRVKMDVLMKMLLITFQKTAIHTVAELSELLLVESLFIEDLLVNLLKAGLIENIDSTYQLTVKGQRQLQEGIFEEKQEIEVQNLLYSACHMAFLPADIDRATEYEELPALYRYSVEEEEPSNSFETTTLIEALELVREPAEDGQVQSVVSEIVSTEKRQINDIPCLEFILYNREMDTLYVRVWNTLLSQWDETLEKQLTEKEMVIWREKYTEDKVI